MVVVRTAFSKEMTSTPLFVVRTGRIFAAAVFASSSVRPSFAFSMLTVEVVFAARLEDELEFFGHMYGSFLRGYSFGFFNQGPWLFRFSCPSVNNIGDACDL